MAVKVIGREYSELYTPGVTDWLLGNVGDWQKCVVTCEVAIELFATSSQPISIDYINNSFTLSSGGNWGDLGFDNGMTMVFKYKLEEDTNQDGNFNQVTTFEQQHLILNIYGSTMEVEGAINAQDFENIPTNFGTKRITDVHLYVDQDPEGTKITYGHVTNANYQAANLNSFIDQSVTEFIFPNINSVIPGQWITMEPIGLQSGMSVRQCRVRKLEDDPDNTFASWNIPPTDGSKRLQIVDPAFGDPVFFSCRSVIANGNGVLPDTQQSSTSETTVPQQDNTGNFLNGANQDQCILFDADSDYTQEYFFNMNLRITGKDNLDVDENSVRISLLKYTNGASMDFVSETTLREWTNVQELINDNLNFNGTFEVDVNTSDSLVLAVYFVHPAPHNDLTRYVDYKIEDGLIIASEPDGVLNSQGVKRIYQFEIEYLISSFFDSIANFENNQMPDFLQNDGSITDNFKIAFFPEWNNPNVSIRNELLNTARLGNTGWFDENFNQLNNDFEIESIEYFDELGNPVESLDYSSKTKVKAVIGGVPNLGPNTECGFGFLWVPIDEVDYKNKTTPFHRNVYVQNGRLTDGYNLDTTYSDIVNGSGIDGGAMNVDTIKFTNVSGKIVFEANFVPNAQFFAQFESKEEIDRNYIIWISVADGNLVRNLSDRVSLLADFGQMTKNIPPAGEYPYIDNLFLEHPEESDAVGVTVLDGITQDDFLCRLPFRIPTDDSIQFTRMTFGVCAYNIAENRSFDLEKYEVDMTAYSNDADGIPQFQLDASRGFKLVDGNNKNWVKIQRDETLDVEGFSGHMAFFATKVRWEDWILNNDTPNDFFDASEDNNGFHNDWIHYFRTVGWKLYFFVNIIATEDDELKLYENKWKFNLVDYDENDNVDVAHFYYRDSDNTLINIGTDPQTGRPLGVILSNEKTRIEMDFTIMDSGTWTLLETYGVITIEIDKGAGRFEMRQLSSVWNSESDNPLIPITGETKLKMEVDVTNKILTISCLVDPDLLDDGARYRISGRVGCLDTSGDVFDGGLYEFRYEDIYE